MPEDKGQTTGTEMDPRPHEDKPGAGAAPGAETDVPEPAGATPAGQEGISAFEELRAELERTRQALKSANREAAERRKRLEEYEQAEKERQEAELSELERAKARAAELEAERDAAVERAQDRLIQAALMAEAGKLGAAHPEDAFHLADLAGIVLEEDGTVAGAAEAVKDLVEAGRLPLAGKPRAPSLDGGAGGGERPQEKTPQLSEAELAVARKLGLKPEQYQQSKAAGPTG